MKALSEPYNDLSPGEQAEYEAAPAKKARLGRILAAVCLFLTVTGRRAAKWAAMALGGFWAIIGALTLADLPSEGLQESDPGFHKTAGVFVLVSGAVSAAMFYKSMLIAAYFEHKASIKRKNMVIPFAHHESYRVL